MQDSAGILELFPSFISDSCRPEWNGVDSGVRSAFCISVTKPRTGTEPLMLLDVDACRRRRLPPPQEFVHNCSNKQQPMPHTAPAPEETSAKENTLRLPFPPPLVLLFFLPPRPAALQFSTGKWRRPNVWSVQLGF